MAVAILDLQGSGQNLTAEQWYYGLLYRIRKQFNLEDELEDFWIDNTRLGPLDRWMSAIKEVVLARYACPVVIFIDEIEWTRGLPFSADEFFAGIREFYTCRVDDERMKRLTFCLIGTATPSDLIKDPSSTLFNIGERIELTDFSEEEASHLASGLSLAEETRSLIMRRILYWTGGHPYLTQRLCQEMSQNGGATGEADVDRICESLFLSKGARETDDNLTGVKQGLLRARVDTIALLYKYVQVFDNQPVRADDSDPLIAALQLSGITRVENSHLSVRNQIYRTVFDIEWAEDNIPDPEKQRWREAIRQGREEGVKQGLKEGERKGVVKTRRITLPIIILIALLAALAGWQWLRAADAKEDAQRQLRMALEANARAEEMGAQAERERLNSERERVRNAEMELRAQLQEVQTQKALWTADMLTWERIKYETNINIFNAFRKVGPPADLDKKAIQRIRQIRQSQASQSEQQNQTKGAILGKVVNANAQSEEVISGATIVARNQETGQEDTMLSRTNGKFILAPLAAGPYTITISQDGYKEARRNIRVSPFEVIKEVTIKLQRTQ
jgi:hypothetical protein